jgi:hypothetical protein
MNIGSGHFPLNAIQLKSWTKKFQSQYHHKGSKDVYQRRIYLQKVPGNPHHHFQQWGQGNDFSGPAQAAFKHAFKIKEKKKSLAPTQQPI